MRWTLAQTFNTILVSSIVTSVAGSPIPIKDDSVDLERREPAKQRPRPAALKLPVRKAPAPARVNKRTAARTPATPRARTPATPRARTPVTPRGRSPVRSPAARTPATPRRRSTSARPQKKATPAKRGRSVSPVRRTSPRPAARRAPASPGPRRAGAPAKGAPARRRATSPAARRRVTSPATRRVRFPTRSAASRKPQARVTKARPQVNSRAARRAAAKSAGTRSQKAKGGARLCKRGDDDASCSFPPTSGPGRPGPDKKITAKNIKDGKPEGWRSPVGDNGKPLYKNWYSENADKTKAAWNEEEKTVYTADSQPPKFNVEHRNEVQGYAQGITNIKDESGNQRYDNFKQLPHVAYDTVVKNANGQDNVLYMSEALNQKKGRAYTDAYNGKSPVVLGKVADFVDYNKDHAKTSMGAMDEDWKKIQQDHPEWKVGDAEFEKTEREASARIQRKP